MTGLFEESLRTAMLQAGAEALAAVVIPLAVLLALGVASAVVVALVARRERRCEPPLDLPRAA